MVVSSYFGGVMSVKLENENIIVKISEMGAELTHVLRRDTGLNIWTADQILGSCPIPIAIVGRLKGML